MRSVPKCELAHSSAEFSALSVCPPPSGTIAAAALSAQIMRVVDEDALYAALKDGHVGGAALDVWWQYPTQTEPERRPSRRPFHELPNVLITPHSSSSTEATADRRWSAVVAANLDRFANGEKLENIVLQISPDVQPPETMKPRRAAASERESSARAHGFSCRVRRATSVQNWALQNLPFLRSTQRRGCTGARSWLS